MTAAGAAAALAARGQALSALPSTMLSDLVAKSALDGDALSLVATGGGGGDPVMAYGVMIQQATDDQAGNPSDHSLAQGAFVDQIAKLVQGHVSYAKSVVKPLVLELGERLGKRAQELKGADPAAGVDVVVQNIPALLKDTSFLDTLSYYKDKPVITIKDRLNLQPKTNDEVRALMLTGHQRTDEMVTAWLSTQEANFPLKVWCTFFTTDQQTDYWGQEDLDYLDVFSKQDVLLGAYLVARRIYDEVQESSLPLSTYKDQVLQVRDYAGAVVVLSLKSIFDLITANILVVHHSSRDKKLWVNGEIYNDWLAKGGKPEILLGMLVSNNVAKSVSLIDEGKAAHEAAWQSYLTFKAVDTRNKFYDNYRVAVLSEFTTQLADQHETEQDVNVRNTDRLTKTIEAAGNYLSTLTSEALNDSYALALSLVAQIRFCHTSSFQILSDIETACKANPNVDVREAALLAVINYLGDWLGDQVTLTA